MHLERAAGERAARARAPLAPGEPRWYRGAIVRGRRRAVEFPRRARGALLAALAATAVLLASGCGSGARQDAGEPSGSFTMEILKASFPARQSISRPASLELKVRNTGAHTVPNVAVTVDSFLYTEHFPELSANKRPIWAIERGPGAIAKPPVQSQEVSVPGGGQTAYVNTWALGPLAPGHTQTFTWRVIPVKPGSHTVRFTVAAGLSGKATAQLAAGGPLQGHFTVAIAPAPPQTHVDPQTGRVVAGVYPRKP